MALDCTSSFVVIGQEMSEIFEVSKPRADHTRGFQSCRSDRFDVSPAKKTRKLESVALNRRCGNFESPYCQHLGSRSRAVDASNTMPALSGESTTPTARVGGRRGPIRSIRVVHKSITGSRRKRVRGPRPRGDVTIRNGNQVRSNSAPGRRSRILELGFAPC